MIGIVKLSSNFLPSAKQDKTVATRDGNQDVPKDTERLKETTIKEGADRRFSNCFTIPLIPSPPKAQQAATTHALVGSSVIREKANPV